MIFISACDHTLAILHEPHSLKNLRFSHHTPWGNYTMVRFYGCLRRNLPFLGIENVSYVKLHITKYTWDRSRMFTEIMAR